MNRTMATKALAGWPSATAVRMLIDWAHGAQVEKGWWTDLKTGEKKERNPWELFALMHSELSEALEADRKGDRMDDKLPERKGVEVELVDLIIRLFDFAGSLGAHCVGRLAESFLEIIQSEEADAVSATDNFGKKIAIMHARLSVAAQMIEDGMKDECMLVCSNILTGAIFIATERGLDLPGAFVDKMNFNASRPDHTLENRKATEGKAY